jgi:hypothetical protein
MIDESTKNRIDAMNYEQMLRAWRFAPVGAALFQGEVGDYFAERMKFKKSQLTDGEQVRASKNVGWER